MNNIKRNNNWLIHIKTHDGFLNNQHAGLSETHKKNIGKCNEYFIAGQRIFKYDMLDILRVICSFYSITNMIL